MWRHLVLLVVRGVGKGAQVVREAEGGGTVHQCWSLGY